MIDRRTRRYLQFSLRGFLVVLTLVCIWLGRQVTQANARRQAAAWVIQMGGTVLRDYEVDDANSPTADWLRDFYNNVVEVDLSDTQVGDLRRLSNLERIERLCLCDTAVSDVTPLASLRDLRDLDLSGTRVRDLTPLSDLKNLDELDLSDTRVRDLAPLAYLDRVKSLYLCGTPVRDLTPLMNLKELRWLELRNTQISDEQFSNFRQALPNCRVVASWGGDLGNDLNGFRLELGVKLTSSPNERRLAGEFKWTGEIPTELTETESLAYVDYLPIFDGGSYGARFRRDDGHYLVVYFLHPAFWTKQAIKNKSQPVVVDLDEDEETLELEVEPGSPFEERLIKLLNDGLSNNAYSRDQVKTLTTIRDCIHDRKPLEDIRRRFRAVFFKDP